MKIGIDYRLAISSHRGMGRYVKEIVKELMSHDKENEYILYTDKYPKTFLSKENIVFKEIKCQNPIIFEQFYLPLEAKKDKVDILWCPANTFPIFLSRKIKLFVTIHDLIFMEKNLGLSKSFYQKIGQIYRKYIILMGKDKIKTCFTVSEYSRNKIKNLLKLSDVEITYNRIDNFKKLVEKKEIQDDILKKIGVKSKNYLYTVSGISPNKNLINVLKVLTKIDQKLVISGIKNVQKTYIYEEVKKRDLGKKVIFTDYISDVDMIALYKNAKGFFIFIFRRGVWNTSFRGNVFELPIIASNRSCIPEIVGDGGVLVDPTNIPEIVFCINDLNKKKNNSFKDAQLKQIRKFYSWRKSAEIILKKFEEK